MEYYEEQLDQTNNRIIELEKNLAVMNENLLTVADQIKETQVFLIKMARNQAEMSKRLSMWPYIAVSLNQEDEE
jgi:uncharacterized coiled-coil protein SlyX